MKFVLNTLGIAKRMNHLISWTVLYFLSKNNELLSTYLWESILIKRLLKNFIRKWQCYFTRNSIICRNILISGWDKNTPRFWALCEEQWCKQSPFIIWTQKILKLSTWVSTVPLISQSTFPFHLCLWLPCTCLIFLHWQNHRVPTLKGS